jgi:predicted phosphodiesterase
MKERAVIMSIEGSPRPEEQLETHIKLAEHCSADILILTGDIIDFPSDENLAKLRQLVAKSMVPVLFCMGNHDFIFSYRDLPGQKALRSGLFDFIWRGEASVIDIKGLRFISLDNERRSFSDSQLTFLREQCTEGIPCVVACHVPMYLPELAPQVLHIWEKPFMFAAPDAMYKDAGLSPSTQTTKAVAQMISDPTVSIAHLITGHVHFFADHEIIPGRLQSICADSRRGCVRMYEYWPV